MSDPQALQDHQDTLNSTELDPELLEEAELYRIGEKVVIQDCDGRQVPATITGVRIADDDSGFILEVSAPKGSFDALNIRGLRRDPQYIYVDEGH